MHIVLGILGLIALMFLIGWQLKDDKTSGDKNSQSQERYKRSELSSVAAIRDPLEATAAIVFSIVTEARQPSWVERAVLIRTLTQIAPEEEARKAVTSAILATKHTTDTVGVIDIAGSFLRPRLNQAERLQFFELLDDAARELNIIGSASGEQVVFAKRVERLKQAFGFNVVEYKERE